MVQQTKDWLESPFRSVPMILGRKAFQNAPK